MAPVAAQSPGAMRGVCGVCLCAVPVSVRGPPPQRYARAKCAVPHCARPAPQSLDCVRGRSLPGPAHFASLRSAKGGGGPRGWHGRAAVFGMPPLCADACAPFGFGFAESSLRFASAHFRESAFIRDGQSIRRYGALGLVAKPPRANRIRPGGVLPLAASDSLWPRGRHASPLARYRHVSVFAVRVPRTSL